MLDEFFIKNITRCDLKIFYKNTTVAGKGMQSWKKPRGVSMVSMFCISGGGAGGAGFGRTAFFDGGGGGGGSASAITRLTLPAMFLPDQLAIAVGMGGRGSTGGGGAGQDSFISTTKTSQSTPNLILRGSNSAPGGGTAGTATAAGQGTAGPAGDASNPWAVLGQYVSTTGGSGTDGGIHTGAVGVDNTTWATSCLGGGAGGAGCGTGGVPGTDFGGGNILATATFDVGDQNYYTGTILAGGVAGGAVVGGSFMSRITPFMNAGGAGGASNNVGIGGPGGNGGYGCGGGGGGAGTTGGRGGDGGDGLIIIISW